MWAIRLLNHLQTCEIGLELGKKNKSMILKNDKVNDNLCNSHKFNENLPFYLEEEE